MKNTTISELKESCYNLVGEAVACAVATDIARELSNGASTRYTLSYKCVWEAAYVSIFHTAAAKQAKEEEAQRVTFAQACAIVDYEENFALAALFVSVWLFSQWLSLLLWIAPRAMHAGQGTRQWAIAAANAYTHVSYQLTHKETFPNPLPETPVVDAAISRFQTEVLPAARAALTAEVIACLKYSREFYLDSAVRLLSSLRESTYDGAFRARLEAA